MKVIVCLDNDNGMMFNNRRQSRDANIIKDILETSKDSNLLIAPYSESLFSGTDAVIQVSNTFLSEATHNDYCFVENSHLLEYKDIITEIVVYKWNRDYPADFFFDIDFSKNYRLINSSDFVGTSHDKITKEVYSV